MQLTCKCLNVKIESKESSFLNAGNLVEDRYTNDYFFKEDIVCMELVSVHKEQPVLVTSYSLGSWLVHQCLSCHMYTHALNSSNKSTVLVNKNLVSKPEEIAKLKSSERYSQVFRILVNASKDFSILRPLVKQSSLQSAALHEQLTDWIQQETNLTEATVRAFTDEQFASLEARRIRAHADYRSVIQLLSEASQVPPSTYVEMKNSDQKPLSFQESAALPQKKILPVSNKSRVGRKASIDAVGLFTLEGMEERFQSDEELSDTDDSGSHDEGIHMSRRIDSANLNESSGSYYAKSLPVNVPAFIQPRVSEDDPFNEFGNLPQDPLDIAASIKALAKSVHGDTVFGDLPRPRFSSQI